LKEDTQALKKLSSGMSDELPMHSLFKYKGKSIRNKLTQKPPNDWPKTDLKLLLALNAVK
jgi:hypothetical protein